MADLPKPSDLLGKGLPKPQDLLKKKEPSQADLKAGGQTSKLGFEPFQAQVPTKTPSVLTEQGKVVYGQEIAKPRPKEKPILDFSAFKNAPKPRDAYYQDPTIAAKEEKAKLKKRKEEYEAGAIDRNTFLQDLNLVAASGVDMLGRMISTMPSAIVDNAIQSFGNQPGGLAQMGVDAEVLGKIAEKELGLSEEYNPLSPNNILAEKFRKKAELNQSLARKGYNGSITEALSLGKYSDAAKLTALGFTESLPLLLGIAATRGAGMSSTGSLIATGIGTQGVTYQDLKAENPEIAKNVLFLNATLTGLGEAGSEVTGTNLLYNQARKLFVKGQKEEAKKIIKNGIKDYLDYAFQKSFVGSAVLGDMSGEVANQIWKNATDKWSGVRPDVDYLDGVGDAALISSFTTSILAGGAKAISKVVNPKIKSEINNEVQKIEKLQVEADNPNIPENAKTVLINKIAESTEVINNKLKEDNLEYNNLDDDQKIQIDELSDKKDDIEISLQDESISDETKEILRLEVGKINQQIDSIIAQHKIKEDAVQEQGLQEPIEITTFGNEKIKPNIISEGAQKEQRVNTEAIRNFKEKDTVERNNSSIQNWLDSIGRSYKKEEGNESEELFRESVFDKESQSGVLLDDIYRKWQSLRAQTLNEPKVGESVGASRARTPLEQQRVGQQNRELAIIDKLRAQETSQQDSEQGNISEDSRKKQIEAGRMVEEIFELSSLPNDPKKAPVARALRNLLSSSTQKEKQLIINEIKNKLYAISQSISSKIPVQPEATVSKEVEKGKPEAEPEVLAEEGKEEVVKPFNETNLETAIELLNDINENKRKAERASIKRKAELESKIAEDESELSNISKEAEIIKKINDNFEEIKKELKEKGFLKIKC